jgi:hypothetical protein
MRLFALLLLAAGALSCSHQSQLERESSGARFTRQQVTLDSLRNPKSIVLEGYTDSTNWVGLSLNPSKTWDGARQNELGLAGQWFDYDPKQIDRGDFRIEFMLQDVAQMAPGNRQQMIFEEFIYTAAIWDTVTRTSGSANTWEQKNTYYMSGELARIREDYP